jgi:hypothetical protein
VLAALLVPTRRLGELWLEHWDDRRARSRSSGEKLPAAESRRSVAFAAHAAVIWLPVAHASQNNRRTTPCLYTRVQKGDPRLSMSAISHERAQVLL